MVASPRFEDSGLRRVLLATDEQYGDDPNGFTDEHIIIIGSVILANRKSSKQWRDQVMEFRSIGMLGTKELVEAVGSKLGTEEIDCARCPYDRMPCHVLPLAFSDCPALCKPCACH